MDLAIPCLMFTGHASRSDDATTHTSEPLARPLRALLLDADASSLAVVRRALEDRQVDTATAADGEAGLARLLDELLSLDVLVMALDLPGRDARALARLIRKAGNERDLALVVVADDSTPALRLELRGLGVDAIVDRADGPAAIASAALGAIRARRQVEEIELAPWRDVPAAPPIGETAWWTLGAGDLAMVA